MSEIDARRSEVDDEAADQDEQDDHDLGIAIVGMSGRFPGADSIDAFWDNLKSARDVITHFGSRPESGRAGRPYVDAGYVLRGIEDFDAGFFEVTPREAAMTDPQHRLFLECAWEALEHAGYIDETDGTIGVYAGANFNTYLFNVCRDPHYEEITRHLEIVIGNDKDYLPTRVSYKLNLTGPSVAVQTACSSSLVGVSLAAQALLNQDCDLALVGGVGVRAKQEVGYWADTAEGILSHDGRCRPFDAKATGFVGGNGVAVVVLKRLGDALRDRDTIYATIRGFAINNDGSGKIGYTAPSVGGQAHAIGEALNLAAIDPSTVTYVEAHGTGTPLGDPIEVEALGRYYGRAAGTRCILGSVKSNIGHLDAAAGLTGLIKAALCLKHQYLPATLNFEQPNPKARLEALGFSVAAHGQSFPRPARGPRRAAVSSLGIGGTNAHVVLEEPPPFSREPTLAPQPELLVVSARSKTALEALSRRLAEHLRRAPDLRLEDIAYTLQVGRRAFAHRRVVVAADRDTAARALTEPGSFFEPERPSTQAPSVAFMFPGAGPQHLGMGAALYQSEPVFRETIDRCSALAIEMASIDLVSLIYASPRDAAAARWADMRDTAAGFLALAATEIAMARLFQSWGVEPACAIGHSLGEYVAAHLAGVFSLEQVLRVLLLRARIFERLPEGGMISVALTEAEVRDRLTAELSLAAINAPRSIVVSGPRAAVDAFAAKLAADGIEHQRLAVSLPAHNPLLEPHVHELRRYLEGQSLGRPTLPFLSNVTGTWITPDEARDPRYWAAHLIRPVRFHDGVRTLLSEGHSESPRVVLHIGPGRGLSMLVAQQATAERGHVIIATMPGATDEDDAHVVAKESLGRVWLADAKVNLRAAWVRRTDVGRVPLPTYPFERQRYWIDTPDDDDAGAPARRAVRPRASESAAPREEPRASRGSRGDNVFYVVDWREAKAALLGPKPIESLRDTDWLVCADHTGAAGPLVDALAFAGARVFVLVTDTRESAEARFPGATESYRVDTERPETLARALRTIDSAARSRRRMVACLWGIDAEHADTTATIRDAQQRHIGGLLHLLDALEDTSWEMVERFCVVTRGAQALGGEAPKVAEAPLLGFVRGVAVGRPELHLKLLDLDPAQARFDPARVLDLVLREDAEEIIALRGDRVLVPRLVRIAPEVIGKADAEVAVSADRTYLIAGGRGDLGLKVAELLASRGARHLVLLGRSEPHERALRAAEALRARGVSVELARGDVTDVAALRSLVERIQRSSAPLGGVIHSALDSGRRGDGTRLDWEECAAMLAPKVAGAWALHEVTQHLPLDLFVLFSSTVSLVPAYRLRHYGAANTFLDALATYRRARGLPGLSISWGLWLHVGIGADAAHAAEVERGGLKGFTPEEALRHFERALTSPRAHIAIADARWSELLRGYRRGTTPPFYAELAAPRPFAIDEATGEGAAGRALRALPESGREAAVADYLRQRIARNLRIEEEAIDPTANLLELGLDSLMFLNLAATLSTDLGIPISASKILRASAWTPTVERLTAHVVEALKSVAPTPAEGARAFFRSDDAERNEPFPLNEVQQAYWIGRSTDMALGGVACQGYFELDCEDLDVTRLERAFQALVERHDMLRAVILSDGRQQVLESVPAYRVEVLDLSASTASARAAKLSELRADLSHRLGAADRWPLFALRATRIDARTTRLHVNLEMMILDGRSAGILFQEWAALYADEALTLPPLGVRFRDYTLAQRAFERSADYEGSLRYWQSRLHEMPLGPALPLALDPARLQRPRFVRRSHRLPAHAWSRLKAQAASFGLTPSGVLLGAYAEVLRRWSRRARFTLSVPTFNRLPVHPQVDEILGEFTTLTPLVVDGSRGATFATRAQDAQRQLLDDLEHRHVSGVRVLRELRSAQDGLPELVTPVVFTSHFGIERSTNPEGPEGATPTSTFGEMVFSISQTPQVLLDHIAQEDRGDLFVHWDAVEEAFAPAALEAMFAAYTGLIERLSEEGSAVFAEASPVKLPASQVEVRRRANDTGAPESGDLLHTGFWRQAASHPEREAVIAGQRRIRYGELAERAAWLERYLLARGVAPGELVAVVMERGWEQVVAVLAVLSAGAAYVPIDATLPDERIRMLLSNTQARVVLTQRSVSARLAWPQDIAVATVDDAGQCAPAWGASRQGPDDAAYVIYTSGSTGTPKGVTISHRSAVNTIEDINARFGVGPSDRAFGISSLSFDLSVYDVFGVLAAGGCLVMVERGYEKDPEHWRSRVLEEKVTIWNSVPALLQMLIEHVEARGSSREAPLGPSLRLALLSGDWIPLDLVSRLQAVAPRARGVSLGGATEASIWSIFHPIEGEGNEPGWTSVPYGTPLRNQRFYVLDERLEECPDWVPGELYIAGLGVALGYWGDPEKTDERFVHWVKTGERLYRTGDLGRYWPDGKIEFLGREDLQVKIQGHRIELGEIESALREHPEVQSAIVVTQGEGAWKRQLVAYVVPGLDAPPAGALRDFLSARLPAYMVPAAWVFLDALPLTDNGKVDRRALPSAVSVADEGAYVAPSTESARRLAALWQELLDVPQVGMQDNFFELGGNSLLASRLVLQLKQRYGLKLSIRTLFTEPTLERLVAHLEEAPDRGGTERPST